MTDRLRPSLVPPDFYNHLSLLLVILIAALVLTIAQGASHELARDNNPTGAVCTTDADCAAWEVRHNVPEADRVYGAPAPAVTR